MGQKHFIICDRCGAEQINTFAKPFHPVGWGEVHLQQCERRTYAPMGDPDKGLASASDVRTLCPDCVQHVKGALGRPA